MVNQLNQAIKEVVNCITESSEYEECLKIKEKMKNNSEINELISRIKSLQKKYVRYQDEDIKVELEKLEERLNEIPIYATYKQNLDVVNQKINYVNDELNDYFYKLLNGES